MRDRRKRSCCCVRRRLVKGSVAVCYDYVGQSAMHSFRKRAMRLCKTNLQRSKESAEFWCETLVRMAV